MAVETTKLSIVIGEPKFMQQKLITSAFCMSFSFVQGSLPYFLIDSLSSLHTPNNQLASGVDFSHMSRDCKLRICLEFFNLQ